jgi:hypothetical protein
MSARIAASGCRAAAAERSCVGSHRRASSRSLLAPAVWRNRRGINRRSEVDPGIDIGLVDQAAGGNVGISLGDPCNLRGDTALPIGRRFEGLGGDAIVREWSGIHARHHSPDA